jgi:2,3,4,5-tetrahydropyridine-2,6-dicarboxylate N-succinyltransferase
MRELIEKAYAGEVPAESAAEAVEAVIGQLERGELRVASREASGWVTHEWVKKAVLLYFRVRKLAPSAAGDLSFFDKIPLRRWDGSEGVRVVPPAVVRRGAFVHRGAVLMPSYVNIGAYVGEGTMVDTWATVGSCAQVGAGVHLSGGVGIGGVLEPVQASPVILEDHVFVGSRCIVVEGVVVEESAVLGAGVVLTASTRIIDVTGAQPVELRGRVPAGSVVIPGTTEKKFPAGTFGVPCALIIGKRSEKTDRKTSLNSALRDFSVAV